MNRKLKMAFIGLAIIAAIGVLTISNLRSDKTTNENDEIAWSSDQAINRVKYYVEPMNNVDAKAIINSLSLIMKTEFVEVEDLSDKVNTVIISASGEEVYKAYNKTRPIMLYSANYYGSDNTELSLINSGILSTDESVLRENNYFGENTYKVYESKEALFNAYINGDIKGFVIVNGDTYIYQEALGLMVVVKATPLISKEVALYISTEEKVLTEGILSATNYMIEKGSVKNIIEEVDKQLAGQLFQEMLTDDEKAYIENKDKINIGLEVADPWVVKYEDQLYGPVIGYLNHFSSFLGIQSEFVLGEPDKLLDAVDERNIDMLWLDRQVDGYQSVESFIDSHYVLVGVGSTPVVTMAEEMALYNIGVQFNDEVVDQLIPLIPSENVNYFSDALGMVDALMSGNVDMIVMTQTEFDYYEKVLAYTEMDIRYNLNNKHNLNLLVTSKDELFESVLSKASNFYDADLIIESLLDIPIEEDEGSNYWFVVGVLLLAFALLALFLLGLAGLSAREKKQMNYLFSHDQITYLPNIYGMKQHVEGLIDKGKEGIILSIDIDKMSVINDRMGHQFGDQTIIEFAQVLMSLLDKGSVLGRSDGDEYMLVDTNVKDTMELVEKVNALVNTFAESKPQLSDFSVSISSISFPYEEENFDKLYRNLNYAMDIAKETYGSRGYMAFDYKLYEKYIDEQEMVKEIKSGIKNGEFVLYIQPHIQLPKVLHIGGEILVRWAHPDKGLIPPGLFLSIAEKNGLVRDLDYYIFEKSLSVVEAWQKQGQFFKASINMTTETIEDQQLFSNLKKIIKNYDVDLSWITIEVTEDMGFENMSLASNRIKALQQIGFKVALDDFGKGYSSLSYLEDMNIDILKIDKSFIDNMHLTTKGMEIVEVIVGLAKVLDMEIIAEGVEVIEQVDLLEQVDGIIAQGYYYSKPVSVDVYLDHIKQFEEKTHNLRT